MNFNDRERLFKIKESEWGDLKELSDQFKPFYELIQTTHEVKQNLNEWKTQPLMNLDSYESIEEAVQKNYQTLNSLKKKLSDNDFDDVAAVAMDVRGQLEEFRVNLPMIKLIKSDAITQEDWAYIKEAVGKPDLERDQVTVKSFGEDSDNLLKYEKEIDDIVMRAEKKFVLTKKLKKLKEEMKAVEITTFRHEKANPPAWILKAYDEINTILDDQIL